MGKPGPCRLLVPIERLKMAMGYPPGTDRWQTPSASDSPQQCCFQSPRAQRTLNVIIETTPGRRPIRIYN